PLRRGQGPRVERDPAVEHGVPGGAAAAPVSRLDHPERGVSMIGQTIAGRYRLVEQIGEGATGTVYRAEVEGGGEAAVKVLRAEPGARERERRFEREAVAGSHAEHPNCVAVRDFGALEDG